MIDETLIETARVSKAWPFQEAMKLVKRFPDGKPNGEAVVFETGYGPSGLPHIGTFQEVLRTTLVRRAYEIVSGGAPTRWSPRRWGTATSTSSRRCPCVR